MPLEKELLEIIVCPKCKGDLVYEEEKNILLCKTCKVYYPVKDDIPILLIEASQPVEEDNEFKIN
jgi:uncharacterized protein YbaR (Trm112 family)